MPTVKLCKTAATKKVIIFLTNSVNLHGTPEKINPDKGEFLTNENREFCRSRNIEIEYSTMRFYTGNGAVERSLQTIKNFMLTNLEEETEITESASRTLRVMRFAIPTGLKRTPFELYHGRNPRTEITNIVKDGKTHLSDCSEIEILISAPNKPKIPIYVGRDTDGEFTNHIIMARPITEERQANEVAKSPK